MQRKMQIENAKNRDQVNVYGGLGKVGLDHNNHGTPSGLPGETEAIEIPGFSASALKYVKKIEEEVAEEEDEFLAEDLEGLIDDLKDIDEQVKEEDQCS